MKQLKLNLFKAVAITLVLFAAVQESKAQYGFSLGPKAGLAVTSFNGDADMNGTTNWFYGVFANVQIGEVVAIQPELVFTERGGEVTSNNVRSNISINYFEVPLLLKIRLPLANDIIYPHFLLGPNFMFRTDIDLTSTDTQGGAMVGVNADDIRKNDINGLIGLGVDIQTPGNGVFFTLDGRYGFGFRDINDNDNMVGIRNVGWNFAAGLGFRIGNNDEIDY